MYRVVLTAVFAVVLSLLPSAATAKTEPIFDVPAFVLEQTQTQLSAVFPNLPEGTSVRVDVFDSTSQTQPVVSYQPATLSDGSVTVSHLFTTPGTARVVFAYDQSTYPVDLYVVDKDSLQVELTAPARAKKTSLIQIKSNVFFVDSAGEQVVVPEWRVELSRGKNPKFAKAAVTDTQGVAVFDQQVAVDDSKNFFQAAVVVNRSPVVVSDVVKVVGEKYQPQVKVQAPKQVKDEKSINIEVQWKTPSGLVIPGPVSLFAKSKGGSWELVGKSKANNAGMVVFSQTPRVDTFYQVRAEGGPWWERDTSEVKGVDNVPPFAPVVLPATAPAPRISLPLQPRAVTSGANARVFNIPDTVWSRMQGRSWRPGCAARSSLRYVKVNYIGFDGYRYQGELVVSASIASKTARVFTALYNKRIPIRRMYLVDRFGYSSRVRGADDYASMAADNTSAFNCRDVVGRPGVRSPHSSGRSIDINPWENPYASSGGWVPNSWWVGKSHPRVAWRSSGHVVVQTFRNNDFRWTYGTRDAHHFDG